MFDLDQIMTTNLVTISPSAPVASARKLMQENRVRHLPVVDSGGALVGLLTKTDLFAATDSFLRERDDRMQVRDFPVEDVMVTDLVTVSETISLRHAAMLIEKHRIGCLPVVTHGQLVGIITDTDFVGVAINLLEQVESTEPVEDDFEFGELA